MPVWFSIVLLSLVASPVAAASPGPCDIYGAANTPCVAAHSMTRALFAAYGGALYRVRRSSDNAQKDIFVKSAGGVANAEAQNAFCGDTVCVVQRIFDQSPRGNHLGIEHGAPNLTPPRNNLDFGVNFTDARSRTSLAGSPVFAAFFEGYAENKSHSFRGQGYSNRTAHGTARGDEPQSMYAVFAGGKDDRGEPGGCCFDYGNAENVTKAGLAGPMTDGAMEAIFWSSSQLGADLENGIYGLGAWNATDFIAGFVKGEAMHFTVRAGDPQEGGGGRGPAEGRGLVTMYDGPRPKGYEVMKKQGGIVLGIGGDNSPWGGGIFYEGVMTQGFASAETEQAVFENIAAAGYGI